MRSFITGICVCVLWAPGVFAGSNAGGTLVLHALEVAYTSDNTGYCEERLPQDCESINPRSSGAPLQVFEVLAVFSQKNEPALRGVEFGISYSAVELVDWGSCGSFDYPNPAWPASGQGTVVTFSTAQTGRIIPVYWFVGYLASLAQAPTFELTPHPENGGHFGDNYVPTHLDEIAGYGSLGFGGDGVAPCPAARHFLVRADGTGDTPTIQQAINLAAPGSVIDLEDGIYRGEGNRDLSFNDTKVTLRSISGNPNACVLDLEGSLEEEHRGFRILNHEASEPTIEGIKFTHGFTGDDAGYDAEGSALAVGPEAKVIVRNCIFEECSAKTYGGAIDASGFVVLEDCVFRNNEARERFGGAIWCAGGDLTLRRCRFEGNSGPWGGGAVAVSSSPMRAEDCVFLDNHSTKGGGTHFQLAQVTLTRCTWAGNQAPQGGAIYCLNGQTTIEQATISDNVATEGAGLYCDGQQASIQLSRSIISYGASGPAIRCGVAAITAQACDIFGNPLGDWPSCLSGQSHSNGNFSSDPLYCARAQRDFRLDASSPCSEQADPERGLVGAWAVGCGQPSDVATPATEVGVGLALLNISPNPSKGMTEIRFSTSGLSTNAVDLQVFDAAGRLVRNLLHGVQAAGIHRTQWDGRDDSGSLAPAGVYFARLTGGGRQASSRLLLVR